jgi:hypothetical protein
VEEKTAAEEQFRLKLLESITAVRAEYNNLEDLITDKHKYEDLITDATRFLNLIKDMRSDGTDVTAKEEKIAKVWSNLGKFSTGNRIVADILSAARKYFRANFAKEDGTGIVSPEDLQQLVRSRTGMDVLAPLPITILLITPPGLVEKENHLSKH